MPHHTYYCLLPRLMRSHMQFNRNHIFSCNAQTPQKRCLHAPGYRIAQAMHTSPTSPFLPSLNPIYLQFRHFFRLPSLNSLYLQFRHFPRPSRDLYRCLPCRKYYMFVHTSACNEHHDDKRLASACYCAGDGHRSDDSGTNPVYSGGCW